MNEYGRQAGEQVLSELPFGVWVARASTGEVLYANGALREMLGIPDDQRTTSGNAPKNCGFHDRQGRPYPVESLPFSRALALGGPVVVDDLVIHRRDGSRVWVRAAANPVRDAGGAISHVVVAFTDITAEVRAVVERAEIATRLEIAVHHAPVLMFTLDKDSVLIASDGALLAVLDKAGVPPMMGVSILEAFKDYPVVTTSVRRALAGETVNYSIEVGGRMLDIWIGPLRDAAGELAGAIGVGTDVTEGRKVQSQTIQNDRIRAMGTVAASVAHEINNPLTYVLGGLEEARRELAALSRRLSELARPDDAVAAAALAGLARLDEHLGPIAEGTQRIREVTRELRTFTRPDDEQLADVDLARVVRSVLKLVRKEIEARARLVEEITPGPVVRANDARLVQVLMNLLINAWQAIPEPNPARHVICVRTAVEGDEAIIEIRDSGTGVAPDLRQRIFEPFVTTKDVGAGSGLGLFVCRNIVISLHGQISVHDAPEGGALFRVALPAVTPKARAAEPARTTWARPAGQRPRILIIDDDAMVAKALAAGFAVEAYEVLTILDGRQGLELILAKPFDLVYCDVMMKDFGGADVHEALRLRAPERLPSVVFMTGGAFTPGALSFVDERRGSCVHKPFDIVTDARSRLV